MVRVVPPTFSQPAMPQVTQAPPEQPQRLQGQFRCPYCRTDRPPIVRQGVSAGGWVLFVVMLLFVLTILFCWIPLVFMKDDYRVCSGCGIKLG